MEVGDKEAFRAEAAVVENNSEVSWEVHPGTELSWKQLREAEAL
jgi:hypothetical protein